MLDSEWHRKKSHMCILKSKVTKIILWFKPLLRYIEIRSVDNMQIVKWQMLEACTLIFLPGQVCFFFFFYLGFLFQTFTIHRTAGEGWGYFFKSSLSLPSASQTFRHYAGDYCVFSKLAQYKVHTWLASVKCSVVHVIYDFRFTTT